jgi:hypothetical protein
MKKRMAHRKFYKSVENYMLRLHRLDIDKDIKIKMLRLFYNRQFKKRYI